MDKALRMRGILSAVKTNRSYLSPCCAMEPLPAQPPGALLQFNPASAGDGNAIVPEYPNMETGMEFSDRVPANEPLSLVIFVLYCPGVDTRHCQEWPAYFARFTQGSRRLTFFPSQGRAARASADFCGAQTPPA
jgi:hypothetical protein